MSDNREGGGHGDGQEEGVGYCRPPQQYRWPKGQSGNPGGKKEGTKSLKSELLSLMNEKVEVPIRGKNKKVRMLSLMLRGLAAKGVKGNVSAADKLLALFIQAVGFEGGEKQRNKLSEADELLLQRLMDGSPLSKSADIEAGVTSSSKAHGDEEHF